MDVASVTVCRSKCEKDTGIIRQFDLANRCLQETKYQKVSGLMFQYADGHEASVGFFRFDWADPPLMTNDSRRLFIGTRPGTIAQLPPHVASIRVVPPETKDEWTWIDLPWSGILEWWFNYNLDANVNHVSRDTVIATS